MNVSQSGLHNRPALYWFDLHQQFGTAGVALAVIGAVTMAVRRPKLTVVLGILFLANLVFAWTYNVGDVHVFFNLIMAICLLALLPTVILVALLQKYIVEGLAAGAVKG